jgi:hypothetical protein
VLPGKTLPKITTENIQKLQDRTHHIRDERQSESQSHVTNTVHERRQLPPYTATAFFRAVHIDSFKLLQRRRLNNLLPSNYRCHEAHQLE